MNGATDREFAEFLARHIENPCVDYGTGLDIRDFYIREAKRAITLLNGPEAKKMLSKSIILPMPSCIQAFA